MPAEAAQLEMADFEDRLGDLRGEDIGHQQRPADLLAQELEAAEDVDVATDGGEDAYAMVTPLRLFVGR